MSLKCAHCPSKDDARGCHAHAGPCAAACGWVDPEGPRHRPAMVEWLRRVNAAANYPPDRDHRPKAPAPDPRAAIPATWPTAPDPGGRVRVGVAGVSFLDHGGTESWTRLLASSLDPARVAWVGAAARQVGDGAWEAVGRGDSALRALAARVDVLLAWGLPDLGAVLPPRGKRPTVVGIAHGDDTSEWQARWLDAAAPDLDRVVGVSHAAIAKAPPGLPSAVVPNGVDPARVGPRIGREATRAALGIAPGEFAILYLGRLSGEKHPELAVGAMAALPPGYRLLLAGDGVQAEALRRIAPPNVGFLGRRDDIGDLLAAADCLVNPSSQEGFGLSMAEAMLAGVPVIATPRGIPAAHPELARLVPVGASPADWARAVAADRLDAEGTRRRAGLARTFAEAHWSAEAFGRAWSDYLCGLPRRPVAAPASSPSLALGRRVLACPDRSRRPGSCGCNGKAVCAKRGGVEVDWATCLACVEDTPA